MLLDRYYKPNDKLGYFIFFGFVILSAIVILLNPFLYLYVIVINIIIFFLLGFFFNKFIIYSINWIIILLCMLSTWETIDIKINKSRFYYSFQPLMKYNCFAGYNLDTEKIECSIHCKSLNLTKEDSTELVVLLKQDKTIKHLKNMGCTSINISENFVQFWYMDVVIDLSKANNNSIIYEISDLK